MIKAAQNLDRDLELKRINMRSVEHLMGVEFIHDLYNRHEPKINSIRFRHTIVTWKNGIVNSYAPLEEWEQLGKLFGYQLYSLNTVVLNQIDFLYKNKRKTFFKFIKQLENTDFARLSNHDLASLLINFQSLILGELYTVNFVQIEHALNTAIKKVIDDIVPDSQKAEKLLVELLQTEKPTASQNEKISLYRIVRKWRWMRKFSIYDEKKARKDVERHYRRYKYLYSAYGSKPKSYEEFWTAFVDYLDGKKNAPVKKLFPKLLTTNAKRELSKLNNKKLNILIPLIVKGGIYRDTNKALLGQSTRYRFLMLDEIARRKLEERENLDFYLLSEIAALLHSNKKLDQIEILSRKNDGIVITRSEKLKIYSGNPQELDRSNKDNLVLFGQCASQGTVIGPCKIVLTNKDLHKVKKGDVMVAIGTDFDLIEAMSRSAAVITEEGGILSHASVVCRELNKPCCIGVKNATQLLHDNQVVKIDATHGKIYLEHI